MSQPSRTLPQFLQPVACGAVSLTVTAAGFAVLFLPSIWTGPM